MENEDCDIFNIVSQWCTSLPGKQRKDSGLTCAQADDEDSFESLSWEESANKFEGSQETKTILTLQRETSQKKFSRKKKNTSDLKSRNQLFQPHSFRARDGGEISVGSELKRSLNIKDRDEEFQIEIMKKISRPEICRASSLPEAVNNISIRLNEHNGHKDNQRSLCLCPNLQHFSSRNKQNFTVLDVELSDSTNDFLKCDEVLDDFDGNIRDSEEKHKKTCLKLPLSLLKFKSKSKKKELIDRVDPYYLNSNHPKLRPRMLTLVLHWLQECCEVFHLKRETYYLASYYFHAYLSKTQKCEPTDLQLIATSCLLIAFKIEETGVLKCKELVKANNDELSKDDIVRMEKQITRTLSWRLYPTTLNNILIETLTCWDEFVNDNLQMFIDLNLFPNSTSSEDSDFKRFIADKVLFNVFSIVEYNFCFQDPKYAEKVLCNHPTYQSYRNITSILDVLSLQISTLSYNPKFLILSLLYCTAGLRMSIFKNSGLMLGSSNLEGRNLLDAKLQPESQNPQPGLEINGLCNLLKESSKRSYCKDRKFLMKSQNFTNIFSKFLEQNFSCQTSSLLPSLEHVSKFFPTTDPHCQIPNLINLTEENLKFQMLNPLRFSDIINTFTTPDLPPLVSNP
ncbi:unnamed protein product [Moneuplotes crassus]|uniref:Cyclin-like domain-containing protein n=1 Tax=Euplotes crassus TaxID=5936 RepID=A0AAD1U5Z5_EUPCR|nr:unnamed protein product [Moneuplotes crassus]